MAKYTKGELVAKIINILEKEHDIDLQDLGMVVATEIEERLLLIMDAIAEAKGK